MIFQVVPSPLVYRYSGILRLQIVDPSAHPPAPTQIYFAPTVRFQKHDKRGKPYPKPKVIERRPGADPGVVAFLDFHYPRGDRDRSLVYIDYTATRDDMRGRKLATVLVDRLIRDHGPQTEYDFGQVMSPAMGKIVRHVEKRGLHVRAFHDYDGTGAATGARTTPRSGAEAGARDRKTQRRRGRGRSTGYVREPWYASDERVARYEDSIRAAKYETARKKARARASSPEARAERIADYQARIDSIRTYRSKDAARARRELQAFIDAERAGEDTSEWTNPAMPLVERPRAKRRSSSGAGSAGRSAGETYKPKAGVFYPGLVNLARMGRRLHHAVGNFAITEPRRAVFEARGFVTRDAGGMMVLTDAGFAEAVAYARFKNWRGALRELGYRR